MLLKCNKKTERDKATSQYGCRYSCLLKLPYFDPVTMLTIDPMHNLYIGTAKYMFSKIWHARDIVIDAGIKEN